MNTQAPTMSDAMSQALAKSTQQITESMQPTQDAPTNQAPGTAALDTAPPITPAPTPVTPTTEPTTQTEPKVEPAAIDPAVETPPVTEPAPSVFDLLQTEQTASGTQPTADTIDYKARYEEANALLSDPEMAELIRIKKAGGSLVDFAKQYTPVDYTKLPTEDLIRQYGAENGWSQEQIDGDIDALGGKMHLEQQSLRRAIEGELNQKQQDKFKTLVADSVKPLEQNEMLVNKSIEKIESLSNTMIGRDMYGVMKLTDQHAKSFREFSMNPPTTLADGTVNENFLYAAWLGMVAFPDLHKTLQSENQTLGRVEVLKAIHRVTDSNAAVRTTMPGDQSSAPKTVDPKELSQSFHNRRAN